jgi:diacylglycerol kinase (ATP)
MVIFINPKACGGKAAEKWNRITDSLPEEVTSAKVAWADGLIEIKNYIREGETEFIAAGGDGTVNHLLNDIVNFSDGRLKNIKLGAIGLGSSNDCNEEVNGVYCKVNFDNTKPRDLCKISYEDDSGSVLTRYFILNSGIGITAEANLLFNRPDKLLSFLKRKNTNLAIVYAALKTILTYRNRSVKIRIGKLVREVKLTNLGIVKSPHFSGNFCYDSKFEASNGNFNIHMCENMSFTRILFTLYRLSKKKFSEYPKTFTFTSDSISIESDRKFAIEFDGEVVETKKAVYTIIPVKLEVCV